MNQVIVCYIQELQVYVSWNLLLLVFFLKFIIIVPFFFFQKFGVNQSKPEFTVDLKGALIDWASKDKSSKKNVIEVNYFTYMQNSKHSSNFKNCL